MCAFSLQTEEDTDAQRQFQYAMNTMTDFRSRVRNISLDTEHVAKVLGKVLSCMFVGVFALTYCFSLNCPKWVHG